LVALLSRQYQPDRERAKQARDYAYSNRKMIHEAFDRGVVKADVLNALLISGQVLRAGEPLSSRPILLFVYSPVAPPCFTSRSPSANQLRGRMGWSYYTITQSVIQKAAQTMLFVIRDYLLDYEGVPLIPSPQ
jgi:hypothetical protein